jgi:hypothetical protein
MLQVCIEYGVLIGYLTLPYIILSYLDYMQYHTIIFSGWTQLYDVISLRNIKKIMMISLNIDIKSCLQNGDDLDVLDGRIAKECIPYSDGRIHICSAQYWKNIYCRIYVW